MDFYQIPKSILRITLDTTFTRFLELMGAGTELKITHTYRNSQELIDIAGGFVQQNSTQIRK